MPATPTVTWANPAGLVSGAPLSWAPLDATARTLARLSCGACHAQGGAGGVPEALRPYFVSTDERVDLGDEGR